MLPYFRKSESWEHGGDAYRGGDGPLATRKSRYEDPLVDTIWRPRKRPVIRSTTTTTAQKQDGFALMQMTIRNGWRESAATAYLHPVLSRNNLTVTVKAHVTRIVLEGRGPSASNTLKDGEKHHVAASREVILCGGTINSPQLLMLSGIGDAEALARARHPGQNGVAGRRPEPAGPCGRAAWIYAAGATKAHCCETCGSTGSLSDWPTALSSAQGFATDLPGGITAFVKSDQAEPIPDVQLLFIAGSLMAAPYLPPFKQPFADSFACRIVLLRPESRGRVALASADPLAHPRIFQGLLSTDNDWKKLRKGIEFFRDFAHRRQLAPFVACGNRARRGRQDRRSNSRPICEARR